MSFLSACISLLQFWRIVSHFPTATWQVQYIYTMVSYLFIYTHTHTHAQATFFPLDAQSSISCLPLLSPFLHSLTTTRRWACRGRSAVLSLSSSPGTDNVQHLWKPRALWHLQGFSSGKQLHLGIKLCLCLTTICPSRNLWKVESGEGPLGGISNRGPASTSGGIQDRALGWDEFSLALACWPFWPAL